MAADYDLVVLGGGLEGRIAAMMAVGYGARVALVEPPGLFEDGQRQRWLLDGLEQLGQVRQRQAVGKWFGYGGDDGELSWTQLVAWSKIAAESRSAKYSTAAMSARGVDVVLEPPELLSRRMVVTTKSRRLSARGVLVACGVVPMAAPLLEMSALPEAVNVAGGSAMAVAWAEALAAVGVAVCLVARRVIPEADEDVQRLVRSQLVASGVQIASMPTVSTSTVSTPREDAFALEVDPSEPALTLPSFAYAIAASASYLKVNCKLQTNCPRLFACGSVLGGSTSIRLAEYEAKIAVENALFLPTKRTDYESVVRGYGRCACAGLTQAGAEKRYGREVRVYVASDSSSTDLSATAPPPVYCKLVCAGDRLVGIHLLGRLSDNPAEDLVCLIAKQLGKSVSGLDSGSLSSEKLIGLIAKSSGQLRQSRWQVEQWRRDWAENWFNWRRSRR